MNIMTILKGDIIKKTTINPRHESANGELTFIVEKVNAKSYSLKCIEGHMKNTSCKLVKNFKEENVDVYGTITKWEIVG